MIISDDINIDILNGHLNRIFWVEYHWMYKLIHSLNAIPMIFRLNFKQLSLVLPSRVQFVSLFIQERALRLFKSLTHFVVLAYSLLLRVKWFSFWNEYSSTQFILVVDINEDCLLELSHANGALNASCFFYRLFIFNECCLIESLFVFVLYCCTEIFLSQVRHRLSISVDRYLG